MFPSPAPFPLSHNHFMLSRSFSNPQCFLLHPASNLAPHLTKNKELGKEHLDPCTYTGRCSGILFRRPFCGNICLHVHTAVLRLFLFVNGFFSPLLFREQCLNLLPRSALVSSLSQHIFFSSTSFKSSFCAAVNQDAPCQGIVLGPGLTLFLWALLDCPPPCPCSRSSCFS